MAALTRLYNSFSTSWAFCEHEREQKRIAPKESKHYPQNGVDTLSHETLLLPQQLSTFLNTRVGLTRIVDGLLQRLDDGHQLRVAICERSSQRCARDVSNACLVVHCVARGVRADHLAVNADGNLATGAEELDCLPAQVMSLLRYASARGTHAAPTWDATGSDQAPACAFAECQHECVWQESCWLRLRNMGQHVAD